MHYHITFTMEVHEPCMQALTTAIAKRLLRDLETEKWEEKIDLAFHETTDSKNYTKTLLREFECVMHGIPSQEYIVY